MRSQYIRLLLVLLISLSACAPVPAATPTPVPVDSATPVPTLAPSETPKPTDVPPTITPVPPFIEITYPTDNAELLCDNPTTEVFCLFHVQGTISGIDSIFNYRVFVFVFPVTPAGEGWYFQKSPAAVESDGKWEQSPAYLGNATYPAKMGDTLKIRAVLVTADATFNDTKLDDLAQSNDLIVLSDVTVIDGIVAISDIIDLTLSR
jgi:hypothetical protein